MITITSLYMVYISDEGNKLCDRIMKSSVQRFLNATDYCNIGTVQSVVNDFRTILLRLTIEIV